MLISYTHWQFHCIGGLGILDLKQLVSKSISRKKKIIKLKKDKYFLSWSKNTKHAHFMSYLKLNWIFSGSGKKDDVILGFTQVMIGIFLAFSDIL